MSFRGNISPHSTHSEDAKLIHNLGTWLAFGRRSIRKRGVVVVHLHPLCQITNERAVGKRHADSTTTRIEPSWSRTAQIEVTTLVKPLQRLTILIEHACELLPSIIIDGAAHRG